MSARTSLKRIFLGFTSTGITLELTRELGTNYQVVASSVAFCLALLMTFRDLLLFAIGLTSSIALLYFFGSVNTGGVTSFEEILIQSVVFGVFGSITGFSAGKFILRQFLANQSNASRGEHTKTTDEKANSSIEWLLQQVVKRN